MTTAIIAAAHMIEEAIKLQCFPNTLVYVKYGRLSQDLCVKIHRFYEVGVCSQRVMETVLFDGNIVRLIDNDRLDSIEFNLADPDFPESLVKAVRNRLEDIKNAIINAVKEELNKHPHICRPELMVHTTEELRLRVECLTQYGRWTKRFSIQAVADTVEVYDSANGLDNDFCIADPSFLEQIVTLISSRAAYRAFYPSQLTDD